METESKHKNTSSYVARGGSEYNKIARAERIIHSLKKKIKKFKKKGWKTEGILSEIQRQTEITTPVKS